MQIFIDIETIQDPDIKQDIIDKLKEDRWEQYNFLAEYHKILCIGVGYVDKDYTKNFKILKWDEKNIIEDFYQIIKWHTIIWFNISWFDIPFIIKRGMKYWISVPSQLKVYWKKPWEITWIIDLYTVYKHTSYNSGSLDTVAKFLWLESSKTEWIDWSMVQSLHDNNKDQDIYDYCQRDISCTIDVYNKFLQLNLI